MTCPSSWDPVCAPVTIASGIAGSAGDTGVNAAWDVVCKSFGSAASWLLGEFMSSFQGISDVNLRAAGIADVYWVAVVLGSVIAALVILGQVVRTAWTRDGTGMAQALSGTIRMILAWLLTAAVATAGIEAADSATRYIVVVSRNAEGQLVTRLGNVLSGITTVPPGDGQAAMGGTLVMIIGLIVIVLVIVLWFELLLRNAALAVVIAVSPISAAGQAGGEATRAWWTRTTAAAAQLIILKPVIALVFAAGFGMASQSSGISALLQGLMVLGLAAFSWPVIARFFTFASIQASSSGLAMALGLLAGRASGGQGVAGVSPEQFSMASEARVMGARGAGAGGGEGGGAPGGGGGAAALAGVGWLLRTAHRAGSALAGRMEQTAAHAGMPGAYPYSQAGGSRMPSPRRAAPLPASPAREDGAAPADPGAGEPWPWERPAGE